MLHLVASPHLVVARQRSQWLEWLCDCKGLLSVSDLHFWLALCLERLPFPSALSSADQRTVPLAVESDSLSCSFWNLVSELEPGGHALGSGSAWHHILCCSFPEQKQPPRHRHVWAWWVRQWTEAGR